MCDSLCIQFTQGLPNRLKWGSFLREEWDHQLWEGLKLNQPETQKIMRREAQLYLMHWISFCQRLGKGYENSNLFYFEFLLRFWLLCDLTRTQQSQTLTRQNCPFYKAYIQQCVCLFFGMNFDLVELLRKVLYNIVVFI